jgi:cytochrome c peroxidase
VRGYDLFNGHPFECFHCHGTFNFNDSIAYVGNEGTSPIFHNTGLYNIDGNGAYPEPNTGVHEITGLAADMGSFRAPTLRNIAVTAPYMHDGSIATLSEVLDHYAAGGRHLSDGPFAGQGSSNPLKSNLLTGFELSEQARADAIAFLESLTDEAFLSDPRFGNPWKDGAGSP